LALAVLLEREGDFVAADSFASRAAVTPLREYGELHDRTALALRTLGGIRLVLRRQSEAEALLRRALAGLDATYPLGHPDHGDILNRLAFLALARSKPDADSIYARAVRFEQARRIEDPFFVTDGYEYLGSAALELGDLELAERLYRRAVTLYAVELPAGHPYLAQSLTGLGETLLAAGRSSEAEPYLREGLANWRASRLPAEKDINRVLGLLRRIQPR
jgi:tetratricopeptide (TPR) repeat protein